MFRKWLEQMWVVAATMGPRLRPVRAALTVAAFVPTLVSPVLAQGERVFRGGPFGPWPWMGGLLIVGRLLLVVVVVAILWRVFAGVGRSSNPAVQILRERYARGEISEDEYRQRLAILKT